MGKFGEDLRMERLSRGIALEDITAVTKISQQNLLALEQEQFRQLPGGILSKGIVRGYTGALGLDQQDWTDRFLKAYTASGNVIEDSNGWTAFASNVGKSRMIRREAMELRLRWAGAIGLAFVAVAAAFFSVRLLGVHAGWWAHVLPLHQAAVVHSVTSVTRNFVTDCFSRLQAKLDS
jgi:cytoskeleton protein RodZ